MKACLIIVSLALLLILTGCGRSPGSLGPKVKGSEISYLITAHPDWSSKGPVVDLHKEYHLVTHEWVKGLGREFGEDCDDRAGEMWRRAVNGLGRPAFGMVIKRDVGYAHALNFYVALDKTLWLYEPQTGRHWKPSREEMWLLSYHWI